MINKVNFEDVSGFSLPESLMGFYEKNNGKLPATFKFKKVGFILELQYFLDIYDVNNYDDKTGLISFAVTSDGNELLVSSKNESSDIFQKECGEIDKIGILMDDLVTAEKF
ncbi:hypothetical protein ACFODT_01710 [Vibrio zhugei]|uniref:SMI1/KNR4 family protein n=1 Tax=Vibrio zhugei TaxID=2479546 RepID=A0ABV7C3E0_9VIBR|nr:hypothetical protein [Vibrio zhugei]